MKAKKTEKRQVAYKIKEAHKSKPRRKNKNPIIEIKKKNVTTNKIKQNKTK